MLHIKNIKILAIFIKTALKMLCLMSLQITLWLIEVELLDCLLVKLKIINRNTHRTNQSILSNTLNSLCAQNERTVNERDWRERQTKKEEEINSFCIVCCDAGI